MSQQTLTFADFISIMFNPHESVWAGKGTKTSGCVVKPGSIVPAQAVPEGFNFFTPNSFKTPDSRTEDNANFHTLFCECDSLTRKEQHSLALGHKQILSAVVDSGNKSLHVFCRLDEPFESKERWLKYQVKLCHLFQGDPSKTGASNAMRLPFAARQDQEGHGNVQKLLFPARDKNTRRSRSDVCEYLDQHVADAEVHEVVTKKLGPTAKAAVYLRISQDREREIEDALENDDRLKDFVTRLDSEKGRGDELGKAICHHVFDKYGWAINEMAHILQTTRKAEDYSGEWPMNTAIHVIDEITQKSRAKAKEPSVSIPELIKRLLRKRGDHTRNEIKTYLVKQHDVEGKSVYNAIARLVNKKELFVRFDRDVELISLRAPALYDDDDFEATLRREYEENLNRVAAYPHRDWNMLSGGGLIRGALTGFVSPTSTGKTHFTAAVAAKAIEEGNAVCIISTEAKASKYVDLINKTITKNPKPSGTYQDLQDWRKPTLDHRAQGRLLLPKRDTFLSLDDILNYLASHDKIDLIIFDYLRSDLIHLDASETQQVARINTIIRKLLDNLCSDEVYKRVGITNMPAILCILQRKEKWTKENAQMYPIAEITGEAQGAYLQPFETVFTLVRDEEIGQVSNPLYAFKNYYVVSKSKEACGQLVAGQEFETTVSVHTNETNEMRLEWTSTFEDIEEEVKGAIGAGEEETSVEEGTSTGEQDKGVAVGVPGITADETLGDDVDTDDPDFLNPWD